MNRHQEIRDALYEYLTGELEPSARPGIEEHLQTCSACRDDLAILRDALTVLPRPEKDPADQRTSEFWDAFPYRVEHVLRSRSRSAWQGVLPRLRDAILSFAVMRKGQIALYGAAAGLSALALVLVLRPNPSPIAERTIQEPAVSPVGDTTSRPADTATETVPSLAAVRPVPTPVTKVSAQRVSDYFRKSKILLIGVANLKDDQDSPPDLSTQRNVSRALIREARYLKGEPGLNPRARQLIDELNRVLIQLANLSEHNDASGIEIVRGGIRQENLLFKIRMAENAIDAGPPNPSTMKKEVSPL